MARPRSRLYAEAEIEAKLRSEAPLWRYQDGTIRRLYRTHSWKGTLMVVNAIGHLAEAAWHHPDILASYASVEVRLSSHDVKGITDRDFELARKIEDFIGWRPGKEGGALEGAPRDPGAAYIRYDDEPGKEGT
jgi:4a-hydroxytetrahydrobiopterin dehydratase